MDSLIQNRMNLPIERLRVYQSKSKIQTFQTSSRTMRAVSMSRAEGLLKFQRVNTHCSIEVASSVYMMIQILRFRCTRQLLPTRSLIVRIIQVKLLIGPPKLISIAFTVPLENRRLVSSNRSFFKNKGVLIQICQVMINNQRNMNNLPKLAFQIQI